jgi:hypothetical protein
VGTIAVDDMARTLLKPERGLQTGPCRVVRRQPWAPDRIRTGATARDLARSEAPDEIEKNDDSGRLRRTAPRATDGWYPRPDSNRRYRLERAAC